MQTGRSNVMNLRAYGQVSQYEPFLNEVSLHDSTPDVRGSNNVPRLDQMALDMFKKTYWVKSNLFADDVGNGIQGPETRTDAELVDNRKQNDYEMKRRLIIFDKERQGYNPQRRVESNDPTKLLNERVVDTMNFQDNILGRKNVGAKQHIP